MTTSIFEKTKQQTSLFEKYLSIKKLVSFHMDISEMNFFTNQTQEYQSFQ